MGEKSFLRFYVDHKVISVSTECGATGADLENWFNLDMNYLSVWKYEIKDRKTGFSTTSKAGTVTYKGFIDKYGTPVLSVKSLINGYHHKERYQFVKFGQSK